MRQGKKARLHEIVEVDPGLMHGSPCFRGTRVPVQVLLNDLKTGCTIDEFLDGCPTVSRVQVAEYLESVISLPYGRGSASSYVLLAE